MSKSVDKSAGSVSGIDGMARSVAIDLAKLGTKAAAAGLLGGGLSYLVLKRTAPREIFGTELQEFITDGALIAVYSATGDVLSTYMLPFIEQKMLGNNAKAMNFVNMLTPPLLAGGLHSFVKPMIVSVPEQKLNDFLLGAGSKIGGDWVVNAFFSSI